MVLSTFRSMMNVPGSDKAIKNTGEGVVSDFGRQRLTNLVPL
jgi:hypothetical protein